MFAGMESSREAIPSNLGCYRCAEFWHARRECTVDPTKLRCMTCKVSGHVTNVCPEIYTWLKYARSRSASLNRSRRQSADEAKTRAPIPQDQKTGNIGTNRRPTTPGPTTRIIPSTGETTALFALQAPGHTT